MKYFTIFIKLMPLIYALIQSAETWFMDAPKSGAEKKAAVMDSAEAIMSQMDTTLTGGAADTWKMIKGLVEKAIDVICAIIF